MQNFDIKLRGKWDHHESENRTLNAINLNPYKGRNNHFPAFDIGSAGHDTATVGCTIAYMHLMNLI